MQPRTGASAEPWRLLETWDGEPGWNMAVDEALLEGTGDPRPVLRFYTWKPAALSLGYFQAWRELGEPPPGTVLVRRFSGGGAIHHADELTFSVTASQEHPLFRGEVRRSYERIHALLARAFEPLGVHASLRGAASVASDREGTGMCFHHSTPLDLVWGGRKGVGSAQRRTRGRVLHHGSIKLDTTELETGVGVLRAFRPALAPEVLARDIQRVFAEELGCRLERDELGPSELEHARRRASHYASETFVRRR